MISFTWCYIDNSIETTAQHSGRNFDFFFLTPPPILLRSILWLAQDRVIPPLVYYRRERDRRTSSLFSGKVCIPWFVDGAARPPIG